MDALVQFFWALPPETALVEAGVIFSLGVGIFALVIDCVEAIPSSFLRR